MKKNKLISNKHILAMKLLGISSETLASLSSTSVSTITRKVKSQIEELCELNKTNSIPSFFEKRMDLVKRVDFVAVENMKNATDTIDLVLNADSYKYSSFIWLGNLAHQENKNTREPYQRVFSPRAPENEDEYEYNKEKYAVPADNSINDRLTNMKLVLKLLSWDETSVSTFVNDLKLEKKIDYPDISIADDNTYKLVRAAPNYPQTNATKHKEKRLLTSFIIKHLERDPNNFVYIQDFETNQKPEKFIGDKKSAHDSWWVYGHRDILDWFECGKMNL